MTAMPTPASFAAAPTALSLPDTRQPVTLWELLCWTYGPQRADRLGLGHSLNSRMRWAEQLVGMDSDGARPLVHPDAAAVHRVVAGLLDEDVAWLVIEAARAGMAPERCTTKPRPVAKPRDGHGGAAHAVEGEWVPVDAIMLTRAERASLEADGDRGIVERAAGAGKYRWRYRVSLKPPARRNLSRAVIYRGGKPVQQPVHSTDQVWSSWCPLEYTPMDPAYIAMLDAVADVFEAAILTLDEALSQVPFRTRRIVDA